MRLLPYGVDAVLVELDDPRTVAAARSALAALGSVTEAVAGACTVLVTLLDGDDSDVRRLLAETVFDATAGATGDPVDIPVVYDGADLDAVAELAGCDVDEVVRLHSGAAYAVRFCGFSPGFAYLDGLPTRLHVPRREQPRTSVPAGSVAIAGGFAAVYPRRSPGGWQLLGRTDMRLWDADRDPPALLSPGTPVRFVAS